MRDIVVPSIINTGSELQRRHLLALLSVIIAFIIYIVLIIGAIYGQYLSWFIISKPKDNDYRNKQAMQFVQIDPRLLNEEKPKDTSLKGRQNRVSRDKVVDEKLPKKGPKALEKEKFQAFKEGTPAPSIAAMSSVSPAQQPQKPVQPKKQVAPQKPQQQVQPEKQKKPAEQEKALIAKIESEAPELNEKDFAGNAYSSRKKTDSVRKTIKQEIKPPEKKVVGQQENKSIAKTNKEVSQKPTPQKQQKQQMQRPVKPRPKRSIKIPVRRIGSKSSARGSKIGFTSDTSAMKIGSRSMAVLFDRYGRYMEIVLRRIQQAITLQRQLSPIFFQEGVVIMTFGIDSGGKLENIRYVRASAEGLNTEVAAARQVLEDVARGKPLPPPSEQMLRDPEFQKITINFVFQQF